MNLRINVPEHTIIIFIFMATIYKHSRRNLRGDMRNVCYAITLEYIINIFDVKQIDSPGYWPIKDSICENTHHPLRA